MSHKQTTANADDMLKAFEQLIKTLPEKREAMIMIPDFDGYKVYTVPVEAAKAALTYNNIINPKPTS